MIWIMKIASWSPTLRRKKTKKKIIRVWSIRNRTMYLLIVFSYEKRVSVPQSHFNCALLIKTMEEPCNEWRRTVDVIEREGEFKKPERERGCAWQRKGKERGKGSGEIQRGWTVADERWRKNGGWKIWKGRASCFLSLSPSFSFPFGRSSGNTPTETRWKISKFRRWHPQGHAATF